MSTWYTRPVFVSSTFKDVQSERDSLRDVVFHGIDDSLKAYYRRLEPIDLRWGVETVDTPEQEHKELLVLKVCLNEIERCRPFLLVILGDRYGWTPPAHRMQAAVDEKGFATTVKNKSVTALEIEYGVLDSPDQKKRSFFYFRTITNYGDMPLAVRALYSDLHKGIVESKVLVEREKQELSDLCISRQSGKLAQADSERLAQLVAKDPQVEQGHNLLEALKRRIEQDPGLKGRVRRYEARWDPQTNRVGVPVKWADMVRDDIWGELKQECEAGAATIDTTWQGQARTALEEFVELRSRDFVGREELLWELEKFAFTLPQSYTWGLCLHGGPGSGKSALFAMLYRKLQKAQASGNFLLLAHAGGISLRAGNVDAMLRRWIQELARYLKLKDDDPSEELKTLEEKKKLFAELLSRASVNVRVVCVIDALNQFERSAVARHLTWLPELWPKNARLITTCIAGSESEALGKRAGAVLKELPRLDEHEAEAIVQSICKRYHRTLNPAITKCLLDKKTPDHTLSCANPLWLTIAVEQLNLLDEDDFTTADKLEGTPEQKLHAFMMKTVEEFPATIEDLYGALYRRAHERFGQRYGIGWIPEMLQFIACSRFGLREKDLEALLCGIAAKKQGKENDAGFAAEFGVNFALQFAAVRRYMSAHLVQRDEMGLWDFMHVQGRKAAESVKSEVLNLEKMEYHRLVAAHLESLPAIDGLKIREIMWHYLKGDLQENTGKYYGRSDLSVEENSAATKILAEAVLEGEGKETNMGLVWIGSVLSGIADNESVRWFCCKVDFYLHDALADESDVGTRIALLDYARMSHEKLTIEAPDSAEFARDLSKSYLRLGDLQRQLGNPPEAFRYYQQALAIAEELRKRAPDFAEFARDLSVSYERFGDLQLQLGNPPEALRYYQQCHTIHEELSKRAPDSAECARGLSISYNKLGDLQLELGNPPEALLYYQQGLAIVEELRKRAPDSEDSALGLSVSYEKLGDLQVKLGNPSEALRYYQQFLAISEELRKRAPDSADFELGLSVSYEKLGDLQVKLGNPSEALRYYQQCLTIREELRKRAPDSADFAYNLSVSYNKLGDLQRQLGNPPEALRYYQQALAIAEELRKRAPDFADFALNLSISYEGLGSLQLQLGNPPEALRYYQQCHTIREELRKRAPDSADFARGLSISYNKLGDLQLGNPSEALRYYQQGLAIAEELRKRAPDSAEFARDLFVSYNKLGDLQLGNPSEALRYYQQGLAIAEELCKRAPDSAAFARGLSVSYERLGYLQLQLGNPPEALRYYQQCHTIREELRKRAPDSAEFSRDLSLSYENLGDLQLGNPSEALRYYQQGLAIAEELRKRAPDSAEFARDLSKSYLRLGDLQRQLGNPPEAFRYYQQALAIAEELRKRAPDSADFSRGLSVSYERLGDLQLKLGNPPEALLYYQQDLAIAEELLKRAPDSAEFSRDLSLSYVRLGDLQLQLGNPPEALRYYQQCLAIAEELLKRAPDSAEFARDLSLSYVRLGDLQLQLGNLPEALRYYQQGLAIAEELRKRAPDSADFARDLVVFYCKLAYFCQSQNHRSDATVYWRQFKEAVENMKERGMFVDEAVDGVYEQVCGMGI